ncbi:MAG: hypothetical protein J1E85_09260 [Ruminococcus sp.]|nr:hypothetical protein [Ruminococcus sp.]
MANKNNANKMLDELSRRLGVSQQTIKEAAESGNVNDLLKNTNSESSEQIRSVLNDPQKAQKILNSPQAQAIIKMLNGE